MKIRTITIIALVFLFTFDSALAKPKKTAVSAAFQHARYVYVESMDSDPFKPSLYPQDQQVVDNVREALRDWSRYRLTQHREEADLVFVVRSGRMNAQRQQVGAGSRMPAGDGSLGGPAGATHSQPGTPIPSMPDAEIGGAADSGQQMDLMRVYTRSSDGKLLGPVWSRQMEYGLDAPDVKLLQDLRMAVDNAYPAP